MDKVIDEAIRDKILTEEEIRDNDVVIFNPNAESPIVCLPKGTATSAAIQAHIPPGASIVDIYQKAKEASEVDSTTASGPQSSATKAEEKQ